VWRYRTGEWRGFFALAGMLFAPARHMSEYRSRGTWVATLTASQRGFVGHVRGRHDRSAFDEPNPDDDAVATWAAMCRLLRLLEHAD
jgi:hypothetical protein